MDLWVNKYAPTKSTSVIGNGGQTRKLESFISNWSSNDTDSPRVALLTGRCGIGKTSSVKLVCDRLGKTLVEQNASDIRSQKSLHALLPSNAQRTLDTFLLNDASESVGGRGTVILLDEIDGITTLGMNEVI